MIKTETERMIIRELLDLDIDNLYSLLSNPIVMEYCSGPLNFKETQKWLETVKKYYDQYGYDYWAAVDKVTGEAVKALKDAKRGRDMSVCTLYVKFEHVLAKLFPQKMSMNTWIQKIKKYQ